MTSSLTVDTLRIPEEDERSSEESKIRMGRKKGVYKEEIFCLFPDMTVFRF